MEAIFLITCLSICQALPLPQIELMENETEIEKNGAEHFSTTPSKLALESPPPEPTPTKSTNVKEILQAIEKINALKSGQSRTFGTLAGFAVGGLMAVLDLVEEIVLEGGNSINIDEDTGNFVRKRRQEEATTVSSATKFQLTTARGTGTTELTTTPTPTAKPTLITTLTPMPTTTIKTDLVATTDMIINALLPTTLKDDRENEILIENFGNFTNMRQPRQEEEEEDDDDDGGGGLIGAIITGFLGSLSKPDGSLDVKALVSVIGMLSAPKEDGSYDFTGLSDTLNAFFGGDEEGGSDVGAFAGGVLAAVIRGVANPPGANGAGSFVGNLLKQVLPAISGPGAMEEGGTTTKPQVNAGGFLLGLLNSLFGGNNTDKDKNGTSGPSTFLTIKQNLVKFVLSAVSSIFTSSSSASSSSGKKT